MKRRDFIKASCISCLAGGLSLSILESCSATRMTTGSILGSDLIIPLADFEMKQGNRTQFTQYVIVHNDTLQYPICVYRFGEHEYKAIWMRCTHQGTELQVFGERLECPAHGSTFDNEGRVLHGPAAINLRTFPVTIENNQLKVSLR
ncbi:MAG TPA: Rieske (2Fe-2S) protein [Bacteroidota bacterium]|nr:Rieske (2Fe-2S) protein [Bacteroidota bacterium]